FCSLFRLVHSKPLSLYYSIAHFPAFEQCFLKFFIGFSKRLQNGYKWLQNGYKKDEKVTELLQFFGIWLQCCHNY
ncbi:MAG: hypothetical protein IJD85_06490, partial [Oscillospiraceae bacterium]|nr:hypothetical protein [Oscillospiraceae bacterium]